MPFTGKATYSAGATLPEIAEDVSDIIALVSPYETPLLDHLGDPQRSAMSTVHEWWEDSLLPNTDAVNDQTIVNPATDTVFTVDNGDRFSVGDQIILKGKDEVMLVTAVSGNDLTVVRQYGGSPSASLADNDVIIIIGNAALEGDDDSDAIKAKVDTLVQASMKLGEAMYQAAQAEGGTDGGDAGGSAADEGGDVVDADFEEVKDDADDTDSKKSA